MTIIKQYIISMLLMVAFALGPLVAFAESCSCPDMMGISSSHAEMPCCPESKSDTSLSETGCSCELSAPSPPAFNEFTSGEMNQTDIPLVSSSLFRLNSSIRVASSIAFHRLLFPDKSAFYLKHHKLLI